MLVNIQDFCGVMPCWWYTFTGILQNHNAPSVGSSNPQQVAAQEDVGISYREGRLDGGEMINQSE